MNEKDQLKNENAESTEDTDFHTAPPVVSETESPKKKSQIPWVALAFFAVSALSFVASIIKYIRQYNLEKQVYDAFAEVGLTPAMVNAVTHGKTPTDYALDALLKSPFPYIAIIALVIGLIWLGMRRHK